MPALKDLTGMTFGHLTVLGRAPSEKGKPTRWLVQCDCENHTIKSVEGASLTRGLTTSCGCAARRACSESMAITMRKHGMFGTPIYSTWFKTKAKCTKPSNQDYGSYGALGITFYEGWMEFEPFYEWAKKSGYEEGMYLVRKDTTKGYEPDNCYWTNSRKVVMSNGTKVSKLVTYKGESHSISEWARITGIGKSTIALRLRSGVPPEIALFQKPGKKTTEGLRDHKGFLVLVRKEGVDLSGKPQ